jgi:hypothetical protein
MMKTRNQTINSLRDGYNVIKAMKASADNRLSAFKHLLGRAEEYKEILTADIEKFDTIRDKQRLRDVSRLITKVNKRIMKLSQAPNPEPTPEPIPEPNKIQDIIEDLVILTELQQTRGDFTREAMLKQRGEMLRKKRTEPVRKRLI